MIVDKVVTVITNIVTSLLGYAQQLALPIAICMIVGYLVISQVCDEQSQQKYLKRIRLIAVILLAIYLAPDIIKWLKSFV